MVRRKESIDCFRNTGRFRCRNEEQQDSQYGETQGYQVCLAFAGHLIIAEKAEAQSAEKVMTSPDREKMPKRILAIRKPMKNTGRKMKGRL